MSDWTEEIQFTVYGVHATELRTKALATIEVFFGSLEGVGEVRMDARPEVEAVSAGAPFLWRGDVTTWRHTKAAPPTDPNQPSLL
jgi:hypothetical protein